MTRLCTPHEQGKVMTFDVSATWILDDRRPDLMAVWFKQHQDSVKRIRDSVEKLAYGGIGEANKMPRKVQEEIQAERQKAAYVSFLVAYIADAKSAEWGAGGEQYKQVNVAAAQAVRYISSDLDAISQLHDLVGKLIAKSEKHIGIEELGSTGA